MDIVALQRECMRLNKKEAKAVGRYLADQRRAIKNAPITETRFYEGVDEFYEAIYKVTREYMEKFGFVNGDVAANKKKPAAQIVWWFYGEVSNCIYIEPCHGDHHASTVKRQDACYRIISLAESIFRLYN